MNDTINTPFFTAEEKLQAAALMEQLRELAGESLRDEDMMRIGTLLTDAIGKGCLQRDSFGLNPIINDLQTAIIVADEMGMRRAAIVSILLHDIVKTGFVTTEEVAGQFGTDVAGILGGLVRTASLYEKNPTIESENFQTCCYPLPRTCA